MTTVATGAVGYSRLMHEDAASTLAPLQEHRATVFDPAVARHGGRSVKLMGDGGCSFPTGPTSPSSNGC